jgi:hypothetical protein
MNTEKVKLIVKNMELLIQALKEELNEPISTFTNDYMIDDYDEVFDE